MDFLSESLKGRLLFAIPKKGRLYEHCLTLLSGADIQFTRSHRLDVCLVRNHNLALVFLPAADIPRFVGEGNVDLGITGQDMVAEASAAELNLAPSSNTPSSSGTASPNGEVNGTASATPTATTSPTKLSDLIEEVLPLGFGSCKLQIQTPERSKDLKTIEDLVGKKIATSFDGLSIQFFKELDAKVNAERGLTGSKKLKTKIDYVGGSVEAACALGVADGIVDLVESGETMRAAGLHAIHTLMSSEAVLIRSKRSRNQNADPDSILINKITSRIAGVIAANKYVLCNYNVPRKFLDSATAITPGRRAATVSPLDDPDWVAVSSMVLKKNLADIMDKLTETGATDILVIGINNCRV